MNLRIAAALIGFALMPAIAQASFALKINAGLDPSSFSASPGAGGEHGPGDPGDWEIPEGEPALHPNGITVTCRGMANGEEFELNGKSYRVVYDKREAMASPGDSCTSNITDLSQVPESETSCTGWGTCRETDEVRHWDTSQVTDMSYLFAFHAGNPDVTHWDTGKVNSMSWMFAVAQSFNQPIGGWDTGSVVDMSYMFG